MTKMNGLRPPLVTVIVPAYNYGQFISDTLMSVQGQSYQHWECIVVDDGSTDNTAEVVARFCAQDARIRYVRQDNAGLAAARNKGIAQGRGDYFQFLDADDLLEAKKLEFHLAYLENHPSVDIVYGDIRCFTTEDVNARMYSRDEENQPWVVQLSGRGKEVIEQLIRNNPLAISSPLLKRMIVVEVGLFDGTVPGVEDYDYWLRCAVKEKSFHYANSEGTYALVRSHPTSMIRDGRLILRSMVLMHRKLSAHLNEPQLRRFNRERMAEREGLLGLEEVARGRIAVGAYQFLKAGTLDRRWRYRAKWIASALVTPFSTPERLKKLIATSISGSLTALLKKSVPGALRGR